MVMRVTALIGRRGGGGGGRLHKSGFDQVGSHFIPADIGQYVPVDFDTGGKALPSLSTISAKSDGLLMISRSS